MKEWCARLTESAGFNRFIIVVILVIGVIINGMDDARVEAEIERLKKAEAELGGSEALHVENQIAILSRQVKELGDSIDRLGKTITSEPPSGSR